MWSDGLLLGVFNRFPPRDLIFKDPDARPDIEYTDEVANPFGRFFGGLPMEGLDVLDLGCGFGGRTARFAEKARSVAGVEISDDLVAQARRYAPGIDFRVGTGEAIPFPDASFDLVVMYDVMEHVIDPEKVLTEIWRVLRPGGRLATVFPPYYWVLGGSHLHGYATRFPGLNLIFTTRQLRSAASKHLDSSGQPWRSFLRDIPTDKLWNQNGLTVRGFERLVRRSGFHSELVRKLGYFDHRTARHPAWAKAPVYAISEVAANTPVVREALCSRVAALLMKPDRY